MNAQSTRATRRVPAWLAYPALGAGLAALAACSATQKAQVAQASGFLGADAARLVPGGEKQAGLRYVNPQAQWGQYKKVIIDPVTFWGGATTKVSAPDQQALVNFFSEQLHQELAKKFEVVKQPGPGTLKLSVAMIDAEAATPGMRSISMVVPQAHMVSNLKYLATGTFPFVGSAQAEMKVTDAVSGQTLAAAVDKRIGGGSIEAGLQWQWGDAENAIKEWSKKAAEKLSAWTSGAEKP